MSALHCAECWRARQTNVVPERMNTDTENLSVPSFTEAERERAALPRSPLYLDAAGAARPLARQLAPPPAPMLANPHSAPDGVAARALAHARARVLAHCGGALLLLSLGCSLFDLSRAFERRHSIVAENLRVCLCD